MMMFPFSMYTLPSCDPPYPVNFYRNGKLVLESDNCGIAFNIIGDKHEIAVAILETAMNECSQVISPNDFEKKVSAFNFVCKNKQIVGVDISFKGDPEYKIKGEERPEVLEILEIIKSLIKMKVFL